MTDTQDPISLLTMVIPTKDRRDFLQRLLRYYAGIGLHFQIIVADSSESDNRLSASFIETIDSILDITYKKYENTIPIIEKIQDSINQVESQYIVFCGDDDFLIPSTLRTAIDFLEKHPDYSIVHGDSVVFSVLHNSHCGEITSFAEYEQRSVECNNPIDRLSNHFNQYSTTFYSVHRTELLKKNVNTVKNFEIVTSFTFSELLLSGLDIIQGKAKKLPMLFMARQVSLQKEFSNTPTYKWIGDISWSKDLSICKKILAEEIIEHTGLDQKSAENEVEKAFFLYLNLLIPKKVNQIIIPSSQNNFSESIIEFVRKNKGLYYISHIVRNVLKRNKTKMDYNAMLRPGSNYYDSFFPVYNAITNQHDISFDVKEMK